jgi:hypothetical protein
VKELRRLMRRRIVAPVRRDGPLRRGAEQGAAWSGLGLGAGGASGESGRRAIKLGSAEIFIPHWSDDAGSGSWRPSGRGAANVVRSQ